MPVCLFPYNPDMPPSEPVRRYFDNAATSYPKPPEVLEAMARFGRDLMGVSPGRGAYREVKEAGRLVDQCRERICSLIGGSNPNHVVFTLNASDALNLAIKGVVSPGVIEEQWRGKNHGQKGGRGKWVHVITTQMEHNSILRPLHALAEEGVIVTRVPADPRNGLVDPEDIRQAIRPETRLIAVIHGSNVTGAVQDIATIGGICREKNVPFLVDAAQTLGHLPVDVEAMNIDLLAFPGHKGLLGPQGTGGLYLRPGMETLVNTIREGGTGSRSELDRQPQFLPDKYEPGSHNAMGIVGLSEGVQWILDRGVDKLWKQEQRLMGILLEGLRQVAEDSNRLRIHGVSNVDALSAGGRCGVFSISVAGLAPGELADILEERYGILTRPGLHCAPLVHKLMGTTEQGGTVRLSLGPFITEEDIRFVISSLEELCREPSQSCVEITAEFESDRVGIGKMA